MNLDIINDTKRRYKKFEWLKLFRHLKIQKRKEKYNRQHFNQGPKTPKLKQALP